MITTSPKSANHFVNIVIKGFKDAYGSDMLEYYDGMMFSCFDERMPLGEAIDNISTYLRAIYAVDKKFYKAAQQKHGIDVNPVHFILMQSFVLNMHQETPCIWASISKLSDTLTRVDMYYFLNFIEKESIDKLAQRDDFKDKGYCLGSLYTLSRPLKALFFESSKEASQNIEYQRHEAIKHFERKRKSEPFFRAIPDSLLHSLNDVIGVYFLYNDDKELIYIGKSKNLSSRLPQTIKGKRVGFFRFIILNSMADMHVLEPYLIAHHNPLLNKEFNTGDKLTIEIETPPLSEFYTIEKRLTVTK